MIIENFGGSEEKQILQQSAQRFLSEEYDFERRRSIVETSNRRSPEVWKSIAEMGWTSMPFSSNDGGLDMGMAELGALAEEFGRKLVIEPYASTVILSGSLLAAAEKSTRRDQLIADIIAGELLVTCATTEVDSGYDLSRVSTRAFRSNDGFVITGKKTLVIDAPNADVILIPARTDGDATDKHGISIFAVRRSTSGLHITLHPRIDGGLAGDISLESVTVSASDLIGSLGEGLELLQIAALKTRIFLAFEAVGVMKTAIEMTAEYVASREQFGQPLAQFQSVQQRLADMLVAMKRAESLTTVAAAARTKSRFELERFSHAIKATVGMSGRFVGEQCIQLHGGIGVTDECMASHCLKRLLCINSQLGNIQHSVKSFCDEAST